MATTTNYGWTTPDDTALVKDGASAIRTLGTAIDTTTFNNAAAAIAKTIVDAKGDIIAATAADTVSRLAVGANDTVLTADSTAGTGLKWATPASGGMTLISTTTLSGASVTLSSIPQTYNNLQLVIQNAKPATDATRIVVRIANDSGNVYSVFDAGGTNAAFNGDTIELFPTGDNSVAQGLSIMNFYNYTNTTTWKNGDTRGWTNNQTTTTNSNSIFKIWCYNNVSAISSLTILAQSGNMTSGTALLYGVK